MNASLPPALGLLAAALLCGCGGDTSETPSGRSASTPASTSEGGSRPELGNAARTRIGPYPRSQFVIDHDLFLAADEPRTVSAAQAAFLREEDEVYGIVVGTQARAYPIGMLAYHHVINDVLAWTPVGVTY